jgi:hypothetical protein
MWPSTPPSASGRPRPHESAPPCKTESSLPSPPGARVASRAAAEGFLPRLQAHQPHQTPGPLVVDAQRLGHLPPAVAGRLQVLRVEPSQQRQVLRRLAPSLVVATRAVQAQQRALPTNAPPRLVPLDALPLELHRVGQLFFPTSPAPSEADRSARTTPPAKRPAPGPRGGGRRRITPPRPQPTAASTARPASHAPRRPTPVGPSCGLPAAPPTRPSPSHQLRSVVVSLPYNPPKSGPILPRSRPKVVVQFLGASIQVLDDNPEILDVVHQDLQKRNRQRIARGPWSQVTIEWADLGEFAEDS